MGWEYFDVVGFDLIALFQGQLNVTKLKVLIARLLLVLEFGDAKPTHIKALTGSLLMW